MISFNLDQLEQAIGQELMPTDWRTISQEEINAFAKLSGDQQWIHTDPERAASSSPFGSTIAHGFFILSLIVPWMEEAIKVEGVKMSINYGLDKVRFTGAVPVNSQLRMHVRMEKVETYKESGKKVWLACTIEQKGQEKPACVADWIILML